MRRCIIFLVILVMSFNIKASAHSGGTDASGGHYCWTNCEQWGLSYGEYHYHDPKQNSTPATNVVPSETHTYDKGYEEAYSYWYEKVYSDLKEKRSTDWNAQWTDYNKNYSDGYRAGFNKAVDDASKSYKDSEFDRGYEDGQKDAESGMKALSSYDSWKRSKTEPDYVSGYEKGFSDTLKLKEETVDNEVESIEVPEKFLDKPVSFILGYQTGFYDSQTGYNYNEEQYTEEDDRYQYILGYKNGWNDEGGSLPFLTKIDLIYSNYIKGYALIPIIAAVGLSGFWIGKRRKKKEHKD